MLNLQRLAHGGEAYYLDQVVSGVEDYYGEAGEAPGYWLASSQDLLGLDGMVDAADLRSVLSGVDPSSGERFHAARNRRVPGWDLTFRAPKSVSVLWALGEPYVAVEVAAAQDAAVARAVRYMEDQACWTRTGRNGVHRVEADGFVAAGFRHRTSRDRDPLLHTHVLVANSVRAADGRWRTIDAKGLYDHARTGGFVYQVELRHELTRRLGVAWGPVTNGLADIEGVDAGLMRMFSKRREWIEERMADWGVVSAKGAQVATLDTRQAKSEHGESFGEQRARWREEAITAGYHPVNLEMVRSDHTPDHDVPTVDADASAAAFERLSSPQGLTRQLPALRDSACYLRPLMPSDYDALYRAEVLDPLRLVSYRHRGVPPAAEAYPQSLWLDVFVQFVVSPLGTETVSGLVTCYALNERNQTAKLALSGAETEEHAPLAMRGLLLFINYLFGVHPIRKLYGEVLSWNRHQFASMERYGATLEGCLRGHELHGDQEVDLYIYGLTRGAWRRYKTAIERQGAGELSPSEAVRSVLELEPGDVLQITSLDSLDRVVVAEVLENTFELLVPDDVLFATTDDRFDAYLAECDYAWSQRLSATL